MQYLLMSMPPDEVPGGPLMDAKSPKVLINALPVPVSRMFPAEGKKISLLAAQQGFGVKAPRCDF